MRELCTYPPVRRRTRTGQSAQDFKYGDKQLDRTYGLDLYDFEARQYDAIVPMFTSIDPLAEKYYGISPYAYCAGDPVNLVDPTGMKPDSIEAAQMAKHVYQNEGENIVLVGGWTCNSIISNDNNGFQYGIYSRILDDGNIEYAMVFAGTDPTSAADLVTDAAQYIGNLGDCNQIQDTQYGNAVSVAKYYAANLDGKEMTIVGHSLVQKSEHCPPVLTPQFGQVEW